MLILKSVKSMFISVQCNTSVSKNYVAHSITVVCVIGWIREKTGLSALSGCLCIWNQSQNKEFSMNSHSTIKHLKHLSNFKSVDKVQSSNIVKFELHHIPTDTSVFSGLETSWQLRLINWHLLYHTIPLRTRLDLKRRLVPSFHWDSLCLSTERWPGWVDPGGWLQIKVVY